MQTKKQKLPKAFKKKLLQALRSGEYEQGRSSLHSRGKYCCLGVACHISGVSNRSMGDKCFPHKEYRFSKKIPTILRCSFGADDVAHKLALMNDRGKRFTTIANWIEKNL